MTETCILYTDGCIEGQTSWFHYTPESIQFATLWQVISLKWNFQATKAFLIETYWGIWHICKAFWNWKLSMDKLCSLSDLDLWPTCMKLENCTKENNCAKLFWNKSFLYTGSGTDRCTKARTKVHTPKWCDNYSGSVQVGLTKREILHEA